MDKQRSCLCIGHQFSLTGTQEWYRQATMVTLSVSGR